MKNKGRYEQAFDGEWIQPYQRGWEMACCDCGLVHKVSFRIVNGKVQIKASRDNKLTRSRRRAKRFNH